MDEPAAGLSREERDGVVALCRGLRDDLGISVVIVEHDLRLIWSVADHIDVMDQGRIVESGTPEELQGRPSVEALFVGGARAEG
jgi:ABC-type branched-subunit amino acid transport system ATPase component